MSQMKGYMSRPELSRLIGVPTAIIKKWQDKGLLVPHAVTENGGRIYYVDSQLRRALELKQVYLKNKEEFNRRHGKTNQNITS